MSISLRLYAANVQLPSAEYKIGNRLLISFMAAADSLKNSSWLMVANSPNARL